MSNLDPDEDHLILLFSSDAQTPVWFRGARTWDDMRLSAALADALDAWHLRYRRRLALVVRPGTGPFAGTPMPTLPEPAPGPSGHRREGMRLAQLLADEVGAPFVVEVLNPDGRRDRFAPDGTGTGPDARRAFRALAGEDDLGCRLRPVR